MSRRKPTTVGLDRATLKIVSEMKEEDLAPNAVQFMSEFVSRGREIRSNPHLSRVVDEVLGGGLVRFDDLLMLRWPQFRQEVASLVCRNSYEPNPEFASAVAALLDALPILLDQSRTEYRIAFRFDGKEYSMRSGKRRKKTK